jgi:tRNA threonylcarbamoyladenosine biosynthesis protein TsaE
MNTLYEQILVSHSPQETQSIGERLITSLDGGVVLALYGELGSGKTCFVQGIAEGLGIFLPVTSPTFVLVNEYRGTRHLYHVDLYRIKTIDEAFSIGLQEYIESEAVTAIEWADRIEEIIPSDAIRVYFEFQEDSNARRVKIASKRVLPKIA